MRNDLLPSVLRHCRANEGSQDKILACREFVTPLRTVLGMGWGIDTPLAAWVSCAEAGAVVTGAFSERGRRLWAGGCEAWRRALGGGVK